MPIKATFTGDVTDLRRGTQQAREEFRKVGTEAEGAARQLKAVGSSFDGSRIEGAARRVASGIERIGGVARLTDSEIAKNSRTISELLQKYERMGVEAPANIRKLANELTQAAGAARKLETASSGIGGNLSKGLGALAGGLGIGVGAGAGLAAITAIGGALRDVAAEAVKLGPLQQAFERLQGGATKASQTLTDMLTSTRGLVADIDLLRASNQATQLGLTAMGVNISTLAGAAVTLGRAVGNDATQSINDLIGAIGRGSTEVLDNLGITLKVSEAQEIYAERLGKTTAQLTDQEKKQAFVTIGMERAAAKAKELGEQELTAAENATRIATAISDVAVEILSAGNQARGLAGALGDVADVVERLRRSAPSAMAAMREQADLALKLATQAAGGGTHTGAAMFGGGPGGALLSAYMQMRMGGMDPVDVATLNAAARTGDINLAGPPKAPGTGGLPVPTADELARLKRYREELEKLTGVDLVTNAVKLASQLEKVGIANVLPRSLPQLTEQLQEAAIRARELGPAFASSAKQIEQTLNKLLIPSTRVEGLNPLFIQGVIDRASQTAIATAQRTTGSLAGFTGQITSTNPLAGQLVGLAPTVQSGIVRTTEATRSLRMEVRNVATAFAQLAQIAGPAMTNVTRGIGTAIAAVDAAGSLIDSLGEALPQLGLRDAQGNLTGRGRALSSVLASATTGATLGSMTTNPLLAGGLGAGGGLATGAMLGASGATLGLSVAVGAATAIYTAQQNRRAQRAAMEQQRQSIIASMGGIEAFQEAVERAGFSYEYFLSLFNSSDPDTFTDSVNRLNTALQEQATRATALTKGLEEVARVQGVISQQQWAQIRNIDQNGPGAEEVLAFAAQQRAQAEGGVSRAIAALSTATAGGTQNMDRYQASIAGVTASLAVLFDAAVRNGESAVSVLQRLQEPIKTLQQMLSAAGQSGGAGFEQLAVLTEIATGADTGALVELASGLGAALAGLANTGLVSPELFADLANGIGEAYHQLELLGKGGLEAARLMQPSLQAIWQMTQDTPALRATLDDTTLALLEFAEQEGLIGEEFRPAIDRMLDALSDLIDKLDDLATAINNMPGVNIPVTYTAEAFPAPPGQEERPGPPPGTPGGGEYEWPMAAGGIVTRPTRALIGEAGPEAVISLEEYRKLLQKQLQSQMGSARPWIGASANGDESARIIGRLVPLVETTTTRILSTLDDTAAALEIWTGRLTAPDAQGAATRILPTLSPDAPVSRLVGPDTRDREPVETDRLRARLGEVDAGIHRPLGSTDTLVPLLRSGASAAPVQITVISQIDGYDAARAITRHQPDVYRTYGAA